MTDNTIKAGDEFALINWHGFGPRRIEKRKIHSVALTGQLQAVVNALKAIQS